jgi:hypothetical protein
MLCMGCNVINCVTYLEFLYPEDGDSRFLEETDVIRPVIILPSTSSFPIGSRALNITFFFRRIFGIVKLLFIGCA